MTTRLLTIAIFALLTPILAVAQQLICERSAILEIDRVKAAILILHSEKDENVAVSQALLLRDRLTELKKDFEIKLFPEGKHDFLTGDLISTALDFLSRKLRGTPANMKFA